MLFPLGAHALATDMAVRLLTNPSRYQAMRHAAIQHARQFGVAQIVPAYESLYQGQACMPHVDYAESGSR